MNSSCLGRRLSLAILLKSKMFPDVWVSHAFSIHQAVNVTFTLENVVSFSFLPQYERHISTMKETDLISYNCIISSEAHITFLREKQASTMNCHTNKLLLIEPLLRTPRFILNRICCPRTTQTASVQSPYICHNSMKESFP